MSLNGFPVKRFREDTHRDELPAWECNPSFGVVHPAGCGTCRSHMSHVAEAKASNHSSIHSAFKDLDKQLDTYFFDGIAEGRRRQREQDQARLRDLERLTCRLQCESYEAEKQLSTATEQLRVSQAECEALRKRLDSLAVSVTSETSSANLDTTHEDLEVEKMLVDPESQDSEPRPAPSRPRSSTRQRENPTGPAPSSQIPDRPLESHAVKSTPPTEPRKLSTNLPPRPTVEVIASSGALDFPDHRTPSFSSAGSHSIRTPQNLRQLQYLMNRAHQPGNDDCIAKVKMLCAEAHQTPRDEKTELQRYILAHWRNPEPAPSGPQASASGSPSPAVLAQAPLLLPNNHASQRPQSPKANNPRMDDPVEVWHAYLTTHRGSWPRGVRRASDGTPHMGDLRASRTVARLRPAIGDNGDTTLRTEFMACSAQLFASPGMYRDLLRRNGIEVAEVVSYKPYRATQFSVTAAEVARHFAGAGVTVEDAVREIEPWAQEYQAAVVFPSSVADARHGSLKGHGGSSSGKSSSSVYRSRSRPRQHDLAQDRFGWR